MNTEILAAASAANTDEECRVVWQMITDLGPPKPESASFTQAYYAMETPMCIEGDPSGGYYPVVGKRLNRITAQALVSRIWEEQGLSGSAPLPRVEVVGASYISDRFGSDSESLYMPELHTVFVSRQMAATFFVLHETAHAIVAATIPVKQWEGHGPDFASILARLLRAELGEDVALAFEAGYATLAWGSGSDDREVVD
jgi:hypothetical protein